MEILSFIIKNQTRYLPNNYRDRIKFFQSIKSRFKAIFMENPIYIDYIVLVYMFEMVKKNFECNEEINLNDIPKGTVVEINNQAYFFEGVSSDQIELSQIPPKKRPKNYYPYKSRYSIEKAKDELIIKSGMPKNALKDDIWNNIAQELGATGTNKRVTKSILVVCQGKLREWVENQIFKVKNRNMSFSEVCPSVYFPKYNDTPVDLKNNSRKDVPVSVFTGSLEKAVEILQFPDSISETTKISEILILGDKYLNEKQNPYLNSLKILADEQDIPISLYANSFCMYEKGVEETVLNDCDFFGLLPSELGIRDRLSFEKISTNDSFNRAMDKLNAFIEELKKSPSFFELLLKTYKLKNAILQQIHKDSNSEKYLNNLYKEFQILYDGSDFKDESIKLMLRELVDNRYVYNASKKIVNMLKINPDLILVTDTVYEESAQVLLAENDLENPIISSSNNPDGLIYPNGKFLFTYGRSKDYFRWFNSFQGEKIVCLYPECQEDHFSKLLDFISYKVRKFDKKNRIEDLSIKIPHKWNLHLPVAELSPVSMDELAEEVLEEEITISSILNVDDLIKEYKNVTSSVVGESSGNAEIDRIISFENGEYIFATENYECAYLDTDKRIHITKVSNLDEGDELLVISIPYSNELYYNNADDIENLLDKPFDKMTDYEKDEIMDWEWKNELREYAKNNHFGIDEITNKFKVIGYRKSKGFFRAWLYPEHKTMLPRDKEFIRYIGIVTKNKNIQDNFNSYYRASKRLKDLSKRERNKVNKEVVGLNIEDAKEKFPQVDFSQETIFEITKVKSQIIERNFTNRVLNREDIIINGEYEE